MVRSQLASAEDALHECKKRVQELEGRLYGVFQTTTDALYSASKQRSHN